MFVLLGTLGNVMFYVLCSLKASAKTPRKTLRYYVNSFLELILAGDGLNIVFGRYFDPLLAAIDMLRCISREGSPERATPY